jgi:hypothetical protein
VENRGQLDERALFLARQPGLDAYLTRSGMTLALAGGERAAAVELEIEDARDDVLVSGVEPRAARFNYLLGPDPARWRTDVPSYAGVRYSGLRDGIDLAVHAERGALEYDFELAPGACLEELSVRCPGALRLELREDGALAVHTSAGTLRQDAPVAHEIQPDGSRRPVAAAFRVLDEGGAGTAPRYSFAVERQDELARLVIDPIVIFSSYVGGTECDFAHAAAVDSQGAPYVAGVTQSPNFPITPGALDPTFAGDEAFVFRLDPTGSGLVYATYFGGSGNDRALDIALLGSQDVWVCGDTTSTDLYTSPGAVQSANAGMRDAFLLRLNSTGSVAQVATYLGGSKDDTAFAVVANGTNQPFVCGGTDSSDFPVTAGAYQTTHGGACDAFVARLGAAAQQILGATFIGGAGGDYAYDCAVDLANDVFVGGTTRSPTFPSNAGFATPYNNGDAFVLRIDATFAALDWSGLLGGSSDEDVRGLALHPFGNDVMVGGETRSNDLPVAGALDPTMNGPSDGWLGRLAFDGSSIRWLTYLGGNNDDEVNDLTLDSVGTVFAVGSTSSSDYPVTFDAFQPANAGAEDAVLSIVTDDGLTYQYGSHFGGPASDIAYGAMWDFHTGAVIVVGHARAGFPTTAGAFQESFIGGSGDAFVLRADPPVCPTPAQVIQVAPGCGATLTSTIPKQGQGVTVTFQGAPNSPGVAYYSANEGMPHLFFEGCEIGVDLFTAQPTYLFTTDATGFASVFFFIPNDTPRCGAPLVIQAAIVNATSGPTSIGQISNALKLILGG